MLSLTITTRKSRDKYIKDLLDDIQENIYKKALDFRTEKTTKVDSYDEFKKVLKEKGGFILAHWDGTEETELKIKDETKATIRCLPIEGEKEEGKCMVKMKLKQQSVVSLLRVKKRRVNVW